MSSSEQYDNIPWDLVTGSFEQDLTEQEQRDLASWLATDPANGQRYEHLRSLWEEGLKDFIYFEQTDKAAGWEGLRRRIRAGAVAPAAVQKLSVKLRRRLGMGALAAAVIVTLIFLAQRWIYSTQPSVVYENPTGGPRRVTLPDGTLAILQPGGRLRLEKGYNMPHRIVEMDSGSVFFDVASHKAGNFEVHTDNLSIRDIGTQFNVRKTADSILIEVTVGRVACSKVVSGESRVIRAGMAIAYGRVTGRFGSPVLSGKPTNNGRSALFFEEAPLEKVVDILEKSTGRDIRLQDAGMGKLRLTANLDGETYEDAIKIICTSLDLSYTEINGTVVLKRRVH